MSRPATQDWTHDLPIMQQSVLLSSIRGPDGLHKNHVSKKLCRWLRRCILISAFNKCVIENPCFPEGGSFTGPSCSGNPFHWEREMDNVVSTYLSCVDEIPHHFQLHFMHAAEILGYKHPNITIRFWWRKTYYRIVNDAHLFPESEAVMDHRLGDNEKDWRAAEEVIAE